MNEYQKLYMRLFHLIVNTPALEGIPRECEEIKRKLDAMPGSDRQKEEWGHEVGTRLYKAHYYG